MASELIAFDDVLKWPSSLTLIRHAASAYQETRQMLAVDPLYITFKKEYDRNPVSALSRELAEELVAKYAPKVGDYATPLAKGAEQQAIITGQKLREMNHPKPKVIYASPYDRTKLTLAALKKGDPELNDVRVDEDDRIRERGHGESIRFVNKYIYFALHPEQLLQYQLDGPYNYQFIQGESIPDVKFRNLSWFGTLIREFSNEHVMAITHHETILTIMTALERLSAEKFIELDENEKPVNCGVTFYEGVKGAGRSKQGKLERRSYNKKYY